MAQWTELFRSARSGDRSALDDLIVLLYSELHRVAHQRLKASPNGQSLNTTELVHESYLRLLKVGRLDVADRNHFLVYSAHVMRSIVVDSARKKNARRHGGGVFCVTLDTSVVDEGTASATQVVKINDALEALDASDPRLVQVVEMRYFAGLSEDEIATGLGIAVRTVRRDWQKARLLLRAILQSDDEP
jgi:RNA polymerase sigma factor (TIGR02999 family)